MAFASVSSYGAFVLASYSFYVSIYYNKIYYSTFKINNNINRFLVESPRWLLSKGHERRAYKAVFGKNPPTEYDVGLDKLKISKEEQTKLKFSKRVKEYFKEFTR